MSTSGDETSDTSPEPVTNVTDDDHQPPPPTMAAATRVVPVEEAAAATPTMPIQPAPKNPPPEPRQISFRFLAIVAAGAVVADLAVRRPPYNNVATALFFGVLAVGLLASGRLRSASSKVCVALAGVLGFFLWIRSNPALGVFNFTGAMALGWLGVAYSRGQSLWDTGPMRVIARALGSFVLALETIGDLFGEANARQHRLRNSGSSEKNELAGGLLRGLLLMIPVVLVLGLLLASGDAVFASFFDFGFELDGGPVFGHLFLLAIGAFCTIVLLRIAGRQVDLASDSNFEPRLGKIETLVVLVGMNVLFAGFAVAQLIALTGGGQRVLDDAGLTFKEYARQGFFQLLWVAAISLAILATLNAVTRHLDNRSAVKGASLLAIGLTLMVVVVAFGRLWLYWNDNGLTPLRFYSSVFSVWIGLVFLLLAARIVGVRSERNWLSAAIGFSAVAFLIVLNIVNPEAIIANDNIARDHRPIMFHMDKLTADGYIALADGMDRLSPDLQAEVRQQFCDTNLNRWSDDYEGALRMNIAERRLDDRVETVCR